MRDCITSKFNLKVHKNSRKVRFSPSECSAPVRAAAIFISTRLGFLGLERTPVIERRTKRRTRTNSVLRVFVGAVFGF